MKHEHRRVRVAEVARINPESVSHDTPDPFPYVDLGSVSAGVGIQREAVQEVASAGAPSRARRVIRSGDILISTVRPGLRGFALVPASLDGAVASTGFAVVRADPEVVEPLYLWAVLTSDSFVDEMVSRCTGSGYPAIRSGDVADFQFDLPSDGDQRAFTRLVGALDRYVQLLREETDALKDVYVQATSMLWADGQRPAALSDYLQLSIDSVAVDPDLTYEMAGVLNAGQGLIDRGPIGGSETGYRKLNRLTAGQVVMRKLTAWEGPIAVVDSAFEGYHASSEFPTFEPTNDLDLDYFRHVCRTPRLREAMRQRVTGSVQRRKRLKPEQLLAVELPIPALAVQTRVAHELDLVLSSVELREHEADQALQLRRAVINERVGHSGDRADSVPIRREHHDHVQ